MKKNLTLLTLLLLGSVLLLTYQSPIMAAPLGQSATATPLAEEEPLATPAATPTAMAEATAEATEEPDEEPAADNHVHEEATTTEAPTIEELAARVAALEAQLAGRTTADANTVTTAMYLLDNVGLHDLDVRLNEEGTIDAGDAGTVARINLLLSTVAWPTDLTADATTLMDLLSQLSSALADDDLAVAAPLASEIHEAQHGLSHAAEHWLGHGALALADHAAPADHAGQANRVTTAIYLLDNVGLHDLDVQLNEEGVIDPSDAGKVARIQRLLTTVDWPEDLSAAADGVIDVLTQLNSALADDNLDDAAPLATQAHETQHDLSHAAEHWLAATMGSHDNHAATDADEIGADEDADHDHADDAEESDTEGDSNSHD